MGVMFHDWTWKFFLTYDSNYLKEKPSNHPVSFQSTLLRIEFQYNFEELLNERC